MFHPFFGTVAVRFPHGSHGFGGADGRQAGHAAAQDEGLRGRVLSWHFWSRWPFCWGGKTWEKPWPIGKLKTPMVGKLEVGAIYWQKIDIKTKGKF